MKKPKLVKSDLDSAIMALALKTDHTLLGAWAADCAKRVLPYFEKKYPKDKRPRQAIGALRTWIKTGIFKMAVIRGASLAAHAAARDAEESSAALSAARACGQAAATAHVKTHSVAAAIYAATAVRDATDSKDKVDKEREWQYKHLLELKDKN
jgi:hypothetical protein